MIEYYYFIGGGILGFTLGLAVGYYTKVFEQKQKQNNNKVRIL